jgi:hypothetical protein
VESRFREWLYGAFGLLLLYWSLKVVWLCIRVMYSAWYFRNLALCKYMRFPSKWRMYKMHKLCGWALCNLYVARQ